MQEVSTIGYSHYWHDIVPNATLAHLTRAMVVDTEVVICGPDGTGSPIISATEIKFNGDKSKGHNRESFCLDVGKTRSSCETDWLPYDTLITGVLIAALLNEVTKGVLIGSEGYFEDWSDGISLYESTIGRRLTFDECETLKTILVEGSQP